MVTQAVRNKQNTNIDHILNNYQLIKLALLYLRRFLPCDVAPLFPDYVLHAGALAHLLQGVHHSEVSTTLHRCNTR